jgi:hypothetical protein
MNRIQVENTGPDDSSGTFVHLKFSEIIEGEYFEEYYYVDGWQPDHDPHYMEQLKKSFHERFLEDFQKKKAER